MASANGGIIGKYNVPVDNGQAEVITTFNSSGTLTTASQTTSVEYLVIAGGGGSGSGNGSGGGGAGGYRTASGFSVSASTAYSITVGAGGAAADGSSADGSNSVFSSITSTGGGGGGGYTDGWVTAVVGKAGGSGVVIVKEPAIVDLQNTSGMWTMQAVYTARIGNNWTS